MARYVTIENPTNAREQRVLAEVEAFEQRVVAESPFSLRLAMLEQKQREDRAEIARLAQWISDLSMRGF